MAKHAWLGADSGLGKLLKFSTEGQLVWEYSLSASFDVWTLPGNKILASTLGGPKGSGVVEINYEKKVLFEYYTASEVFGCQPLPNGNILIGELEPCRIIEVNRQGQIEFELKCRTSCVGHDSMRIPRQLVNGNFLVCHKGEQVVREYDCAGKVLREIASPGPVFVALRLPNGNTLFSSEEKVIEVDTTNQIVWELSDKDVPEMGIKLLTGLQRLPNGNTMVCNWLGHNQEGNGVPLFEVTNDKKVVWKFTDVATTRNLGNFQLLDAPGERF